jgi:archaetidylinositol phosphate synthase
MNRVEFFDSWSRLHGNAQIKGIVKAWLSISYVVCAFLNRLRISPNGLTYLSLLLGIGFVIYIDSNWAILFLVLSLAADGLDGSLAIISQKVSKWGAALDAVIDRCVEGLWFFGVYLLGAPLEVLLMVWLASFIQEYMRARAGGLGVHEIGIVTISERPVRASFILIILVGRIFELDLAAPVTITWLVLQVFSAFTVLSFLRPLLRQSQR